MFYRAFASLLLLGVMIGQPVGQEAKSPEGQFVSYQFQDGVKLKVHFTDEILKKSGETDLFPREVLDAAVQAYETLVELKGFSADGFSIASPNKKYAYDPDSTIDIYLGVSSQPNPYQDTEIAQFSFKDAPCFDTIKVSDTAFQAVILLPADYKAFIRNWEKVSPSSVLGIRNVEIDLRGTLIHEMTHAILFYYNKNLNKNSLPAPHLAQASSPEKVDWFVEGLARYFETFVGARHDFYSQGFKEVLPDKIRFSRGGANFFMSYPDQPFMELRYENALFWRFIDTRYGMQAIEKICRKFRFFEKENLTKAIENATQTPFKTLLKDFAVAVLLKDFGLKEDSAYLMDVSRAQLFYEHESIYLKETVSGWATDYCEISFAESVRALPGLEVRSDKENTALATQVLLMTKGGNIIQKDFNGELCLEKELQDEGLHLNDLNKFYLLVTNLEKNHPADYEVIVRSSI